MKILLLFLAVFIFASTPLHTVFAQAAGGKEGALDIPNEGATKMRMSDFLKAVSKDANGAPKINMQLFGSLWWETTALKMVNEAFDLKTDADGKFILSGGGVVGGLANSMDNMIAMKPVSGVDYTTYLANQVKFPLAPKTAYAAYSLGYSGLTPVLSLWKLSRNFAYLLFALLFVIIGAMIILRVKIDAKTVASVQNALPKIFLSLILITFSYAIVGFLIDLMYVLTGLIYNLLASQIDLGQDIVSKDLPVQLAQGSIFNVFGIQGIFATAKAPAEQVGKLIEAAMGKGTPLYGEKVAGFGSAALAWLIFSFAIVYSLFKTWITLLTAYFQIILGVIAGPIMLAAGAIPGRNTIGPWMRNMIANIMLFPFIILYLLVGFALVSSPYWNSTTNPGFVAPLLGSGLGQPGAIAGILGFILLLSMPKAATMLQELLKAPGLGQFGNAWQEAMQFGYRTSPASGWASSAQKGAVGLAGAPFRAAGAVAGAPFRAGRAVATAPFRAARGLAKQGVSAGIGMGRAAIGNELAPEGGPAGSGAFGGKLNPETHGKGTRKASIVQGLNDWIRGRRT